MSLRYRRSAAATLLWLTAQALAFSAAAQQQGVSGSYNGRGPEAQIAIIIDDLGLRLEQDLRVLALPGAVTNAILPRATHTQRIAALAQRLGKEVMIHLPMESIGYGQLDEGGLTSKMGYEDFERLVASHIAAVPQAVGINNHMGSLLTSDNERMRWLMEVISARRGLYFIDSRTSVNSVAYRYARDQGIPSRARDVFLDNVLDEAQIEHQFDRLIALAKRHGQAIAIGHPNRETIAVLERRLPLLAQQGVELVAVSDMLRGRPQKLPSPQEQPQQQPLRVAQRDLFEEFVLQSGVLRMRPLVQFFHRGVE